MFDVICAHLREFAASCQSASVGLEAERSAPMKGCIIKAYVSSFSSVIIAVLHHESHCCSPIFFFVKSVSSLAISENRF